MSKMPGDKWLSGPGVPEGQMGAQPAPRIITIPLEGDGELHHLKWDDPPGDLTPEEYESKIRGAAALAVSVGELIEALVPGLVGDLIFSHGVEPQRAVEAVTEFAARIFAEEHPAT